MLIYTSINKGDVSVKGSHKDMNDTTVLSSSISLSKSVYLKFKRLFDIVVSSVALIILSPILLGVIIAIRVESKGKAVFTQERIGLNGKLFKLYKFRSMVDNADEELYQMLKSNKKIREEYKVNKKLKDDPRITKVGKFIRKLSIDELPQLVNVFKGEMSLIGNRPYLPREKDDMGPYYNDIVMSKPGITGLWQTSGRSNTTFKTRCKIEAEYSKSMSLRTDIKIFFKTFVVVFKGL